MARIISQTEALQALRILEQECGYVADRRETETFIVTVTDTTRPCSEYRFMGALGFGGKFRNDGNHDNVPYVDCYPEDATPERQAMIETANARLRNLFVAVRS